MTKSAKPPQTGAPTTLFAPGQDAARDGFRDSLPLAMMRAREAVMTLFRPLLKAHGLTEQQWRLIRIVHENGSLEFNSLADMACILPPSLTGILGRLEQAGLITRERSLPDQRKLSIGLTEAGESVFHNLMPEVERIYLEVIEQRIDPAEIEQLFHLLRKIRRVAETAPVDNASVLDASSASGERRG